MNGRTLLLTVGAIMAILLLIPVMTMAQTIWIYGQVQVGSNYTNGLQVTLVGPVQGSPTTITANNTSNSLQGYYQFVIDNGSPGGYTVEVTKWNHIYSQSGNVVDTWHVEDISVPATAPSPSPTVTPTPTPRPSTLTGGMVTQVNQSSFVPVSPVVLSATPLPAWTPTAAPTFYPTLTPTPIPTPSAGPFSNISLWLAGMVVAIIVVVVAAALVLIYIRRY